MVTVSHLVKKYVSENSFLQEAMSKELISYGNLAEQLKADIEKELGKKVKESAIIMALRRHAETLTSFNKKLKKNKFKTEIVLKTNLIDFNVLKSTNLMNKIKNLYSLVNFEKGDTLNIVLGNNEVSIVTKDKYKDKILNFLKGEKIITKEYDLIGLSIIFTDENYSFFEIPGVIFTYTRNLAWENINIFEIISTKTELTFILRKKDSMKAYNVLQAV